MDVEFRRSLKAVFKVTDWLTRGDQALQAFVEARRARLPANVAAFWSALTLAITFVPVLEDFWGQIVAQAPGLAAWMRHTMEERHWRLERAAAGTTF